MKKSPSPEELTKTADALARTMSKNPEVMWRVKALRPFDACDPSELRKASDLSSQHPSVAS